VVHDQAGAAIGIEKGDLAIAGQVVERRDDDAQAVQRSAGLTGAQPAGQVAQLMSATAMAEALACTNGPLSTTSSSRRSTSTTSERPSGDQRGFSGQDRDGGHGGRRGGRSPERRQVGRRARRHHRWAAATDDQQGAPGERCKTSENEGAAGASVHSADRSRRLSSAE
jgi:hypothetical protein